MEYSSPLAAMHPPPCPAWGIRKDLPVPRCLRGSHTFGPNSFNFRDLSMKPSKPAKSNGDRFTMRPVRGSSPTSSLTADLDANFHIDQSPHVPTPRRSLFKANLFKPTEDHGRSNTPPAEEAGAMTSPILSSSPGIDSMDISPLPHKAPWFQVTLPAPTPEDAPAEVDMLSSEVPSPQKPSSQSAPLAQAPVFLLLPERKRPQTRPGLTRSKGFSTTNITLKSHNLENQLPPFRFGNGGTGPLLCASTQGLVPSYTASPVDMDEWKPIGVAPMPPTYPRRTSIGASRPNGSPASGHVRKPSNGRPPLSRPPRKQMRRSLSMFQHPNDVMKEEQNTYESPPGLQSVRDLDDEPLPKLPHFVPEEEPDSLPRVTQETMVDILNGKYHDGYDSIYIIDCRFEYEYEGGHISGAVNFNDKSLLANELFNNAAPHRTLLIFHCEYSVHRAPLTAKFIRGHDRKANTYRYPQLTYPEIYILDGGYSSFFAQSSSKCYPQNYVEMNDKNHQRACERGMGKLKQTRAKLCRAQTFAFGSNHMDDEMEDSPTAGGRGTFARSRSTFDVGPDIAMGIGQSFQRRMASY